MVLILSNESDRSTELVIDWLQSYHVPFCRINDTDKLHLNEISFTPTPKFILTTNQGQIIDSNDITAYWYRRGELNIKCGALLNNSALANDDLLDHLNSEKWYILDCIYSILEDKICINSIRDNNINKLTALKLATEAGLEIPLTIINSSKEAMECFLLRNNNILSKAIKDFPRIKQDGIIYESANKAITQSDLARMDSYFFYSLCQKYIDKSFEIRSFFLENKFYSMAIFSQADPETKFDFRNYNLRKMNRMIPFILPKEVEWKLKYVFDKLRINCSSVDIIFTSNGEYVFLEINPVGQFGMVSKPCNYHLEEKIAYHLKSIKE